MENTRRNHKGHGAHRRFFRWVKEKMTGTDAFDIIFGEKGKEYPKEMMEEFTALFDQMKETHAKLHENRAAFMDKWKEYMPERPEFPSGGHFGKGHPFGGEMESCGGHGGGFSGHGRGFGW